MPSVNINGKSLFYTDSPQEDNGSPRLTTVLIHGLGSSSCFYHPIIPQLQPVSRCLALDTPGSGLSTLGATEQSITTIADDILAFLDAVDVKGEVVVVGHSMGGILASRLAATKPERVRGVVLVGPVNPSAGAAKAFEDRIAAVKKDGLENLAATIPSAATGQKAGPLQRAFVRALILGTSPEGYISLCNVIAKAERPDYETIKAPVLLLAGGDDKTSPIAGCEAILEAYGTSKEKKELKLLEGVGHWHCVEAPEEVGRLAAQFIKSIA